MAIQPVELPPDLQEEFEELSVQTAAIQMKYQNFCTAINEEQKQLAGRARDLWKQTLHELDLQGQWRYDDGAIYPIDGPGTN